MNLHNEHFTQKKSTLYNFIFLLAIIIVAMNLRPAITSIGPLISMIQSDLNLTHTSAGFLSSLPLIAFALLSPIVPRIVRAITLNGSLLIGFLVLGLGVVLRSFNGITLLFVGTLLIGVGIAICNVLLPVLAKEKFPNRIGAVTSTYSTSIGIFAALASGISVPLAVKFQLGWSNALLVWIIPVILGIFISMIIIKIDKNSRISEIEPTPTNQKKARVWSSMLAWQIALFFGFQSTLFYITVAWLPDILIDKGIELSHAGWLLSISQFVGLPASIIVPILASRFKSQSLLTAIVASFALIGYLGILTSEAYHWIFISICFMGISLSGSFALGLVFIGLRSRNTEDSAELSGMVQSFGYGISAVGPILIGSLFDLTSSWDVPLLTLASISVLVIVFGIGSGRNQYV